MGNRVWVGDISEHTAEGEFLGILMNGIIPMAVVRFKGMEIRTFRLDRVHLGKPTDKIKESLR